LPATETTPEMIAIGVLTELGSDIAPKTEGIITERLA